MPVCSVSRKINSRIYCWICKIFSIYAIYDLQTFLIDVVAPLKQNFQHTNSTFKSKLETVTLSIKTKLSSRYFSLSKQNKRKLGSQIIHIARHLVTSFFRYEQVQTKTIFLETIQHNLLEAYFIVWPSFWILTQSLILLFCRESRWHNVTKGLSLNSDQCPPTCTTNAKYLKFDVFKLEQLIHARFPHFKSQSQKAAKTNP